MLIDMGRQRVEDKTIRPLTTITQITPSQVIPDATRAGVIPVGNYKGAVAFWDLDKAVNQPLVLAEQQHILGILDGREEGYDLRTVGIVLAEQAGTVHPATLTVPAGQVWYIDRVIGTLPAPGGATNVLTYNWRCSLWTDRAATPSTAGQAFHAAALDFGFAGGIVYDDFGIEAVWWAITNKQVLLRLPAGSILTCVFTNTLANAFAAVNCTFQIYGFIGKALVA